jgi:hypothetical protein
MSRQNQQKGIQLNCFSPPVMLATLIIETLLAIYTVWRYKMTPLTRLVVITLLALASFQLAEYFVCTGYGLHAEQWSRLGFVMIAALPPLGLHIMHVLADKPRRRLVAVAYATMIGFMVFFLTYHTAFIGHECTGNYVIFQLGPKMGGWYYVYYFGWLAAGIGLGAKWANQLMKQTGQAARRRLATVRAMIIGYLVFLLPVALANAVKPQTRRGIPSIICGFAVLLALILVLYILPRADQLKRPSVDKIK